MENMNREILFRGKHIHAMDSNEHLNGTWVHGYLSDKGHTVKVIAISQDTEAPGQFYVVYECEDGAIWNRPYGMFVSEVDHVKYPNVQQKYRFELVED